MNNIVNLADKKASESNGNDLAKFLSANKKQIESVLPDHIKPERIMRLMLNEVRSNPKLLDCTIESLFGAFMTCAKLGLEVGNGLGLAYVIPFRNSKENRHDVQVIFGYQGLADLITRGDRVASIMPRVVYENDIFDLDYSYDFPIAAHKPAFKNPGESIGYYAVAKFKDGHREVYFMSKDQVKEHRDQYCRNNAYYQGKPNERSPWFTAPDAMGMKTVIRMMAKYLPKNPHLSQALVMETSAETGQPQNLESWIEGEVIHPEPEAPPPIPDQFIDAWQTVLDAEKDGTQAMTKAFYALPDAAKNALKPNFNEKMKDKK